jgi:hypothetical protein
MRPLAAKATPKKTTKIAASSHRARKSESPSPPAQYADLRALFLNCTLKCGNEVSHTERLIHVAAEVMHANGVHVDVVRPVDLELAPGVQPDMTQHGAKRDDWPKLCKQVMAADIRVLCTPIWLGEESSVCRRVIERLYSESGKLNTAG